MKTLQFVHLIFLSVCLSFNALAQSKTGTFVVSGECGMCKKKIEMAAKEAGATYAVWRVDSKKLTVKYNSETSNVVRIQQAIADAGYDTPAATASDAAYNSLHECCKYERTMTKTEKACCRDAGSCTNGTCAKDLACCKDGTCCTEGACTHESTHAAKAGESCCAKH